MSHAHAYPVHVTSSTINTTHNTQRKCSSRPCEYMLRSHPNGILSVALWSFQWIMDTLCIIINLCGTLAKQNRTKKNFNITFFFSFCHSDAIFLACRTYFFYFLIHVDVFTFGSMKSCTSIWRNCGLTHSMHRTKKKIVNEKWERKKNYIAIVKKCNCH